MNKNRDYYRLLLKNIVLKKLYGISLNELLDTIRKQDGRCAICRCMFSTSTKINDPAQATVDHDHSVDEDPVRGILCRRCNAVLARVENGYILQKPTDFPFGNQLQEYLIRWQEKLAAR